MTYATFGFVESKPDKGAELAEVLSAYNSKLVDSGCLYCVVGLSEEEPDKVLISELWTSKEAYQAFQKNPGIIKSLFKIKPLVTRVSGSTKFEAVGSPLQD